MQIGSALASSLGQLVRMPESRLRVLVACGAAGGIAATFNAPITGVFFGVEVILREFSIEAIFTVMLSAMVADVVSQQFLGAAPFLSGFPSGIALGHARNYLLVALLAVVAAVLGLAFKNVLYKTEDVCDRVCATGPNGPAGRGRGRPRPAAPGGAAAVRRRLPGHVQGRGRQLRPVVPGRARVHQDGGHQPDHRDRGFGGRVRPVAVHWGHLRHGLRRGRQPPVRPRGRAARPVRRRGHGGRVHLRRPRPLTSLASVVEMTGDYTLTLPVMLAVAIATVVSRALSYGTIYTTKLLRRGIDIDHPPSADPFEELTAADAMRPFQLPLTADPVGPHGSPDEDGTVLPGPVTHQGAPQVLFANEPLAQAVRQLVNYGRDGLPVLSIDGQQLEGWLTSPKVLQAIARQMATALAAAMPPGHLAAGWPWPTNSPLPTMRPSRYAATR